MSDYDGAADRLEARCEDVPVADREDHVYIVTFKPYATGRLESVAVRAASLDAAKIKARASRPSFANGNADWVSTHEPRR